ncbi:hypothetical protein [Tenacibaculum maritimum]|uniref:hypothetical protein n=1 Tax=Tenacibaculum maritimum TaxID=107401 RepID=UPI0023078C02|nr:hypothetical protein [Tenacibaculum maritimum]MDB0601678.1 hypothetical protein [Tenacibaculum maritimum]MDB0612804.1 hypothetical protein [Tenacibaculum maritimum]
MKNINFILTLFASLSLIFTSCDDTGETTIVDQGIKSGGVVTTLSGSTGKLLGAALNPNDLINSEVTLTNENAELLLKVAAEPGHIPSGVTKYELVKSFKDGAEVSVKESTSLPFSMEYNTVDEFLSGLNIDKKNLRIGDKINFKVKVYLNNGDVLYQASNKSKFNITINCASDLAGAYSLRFTSNFGHDITFPNEVISEVTPGYYKTTTTYRWTPGEIAPDQGFNFNDICGTITVPRQDLAQGTYNNQVYGFQDGIVNVNDNTITIYYIIEFAGGDTKIECKGVYTKL